MAGCGWRWTVSVPGRPRSPGYGTCRWTGTIDETLVRSVAVEPTDAVLMRLVIECAHCVGLRVCAQGADRHAQLEQLATRGCDAVQGHLRGGPVEVELLDTRTHSARRLVLPNARRHRRTCAEHLVAVVRDLGRS